jgi:hypothetical protein
MKRLLTQIVAVVAMVACSSEEIVEVRYLASDRAESYLYAVDEQSKQLSVADTLVRGAALNVVVNGAKKFNDTEYLPVKVDKQLFYAPAAQIVATHREVVQEKSIFVRTPASIISDITTSKVGANANKGAELAVVGYDTLYSNGRVNRYIVRQGNTEGYIYAKYTVYSKEDALKRYKAEEYDKVHKAIKNPFGGGEAIGCDFYPT